MKNWNKDGKEDHFCKKYYVRKDAKNGKFFKTASHCAQKCSANGSSGEPVHFTLCPSSHGQAAGHEVQPPAPRSSSFTVQMGEKHVTGTLGEIGQVKCSEGEIGQINTLLLSSPLLPLSLDRDYVPTGQQVPRTTQHYTDTPC